mmetsp:Transcript_10580/g.20298  ORF Transcript_10580/g.20298 Transcript_10580/m.20298 type:complete len:139 (+) Transcript_10580:118-534(+)
MFANQCTMCDIAARGVFKRFFVGASARSTKRAIERTARGADAVLGSQSMQLQFNRTNRHLPRRRIQNLLAWQQGHLANLRMHLAVALAIFVSVMCSSSISPLLVGLLDCLNPELVSMVKISSSTLSLELEQVVLNHHL